MMIYAILVLAAATVAADQPKAKAKPAPAPAKVTGPPANSVQIDDVTYRWTDEKGRAWIYRRTPFGWAKIDEAAKAEAVKASGAAAAAAPSAPVIRAFEEGDNVRFEKNGPFGVYSWKKKKTELLPEEMLAVENARKQRK